MKNNNDSKSGGFQPLITLSSDFAVQSQGVGTMEAVAFSIAPQAKIIHLMHGIAEFDLIAAARTMETVIHLPVGIHVCVCDPGVGTARRAIAIETRRGDYFVGPDNGLFVPATRLLGGAVRVHELTNPQFMRQPVSHIFHGRDIFAPAAAYLATGVPLERFGSAIDLDKLVEAPYGEAIVVDGVLRATVIQINRFGSFHLNILHGQWDALGFRPGGSVALKLQHSLRVVLPIGEKFGDVSPAANLIMKDDYGRVEIAKNLGSVIHEIPVKIGDVVEIELVKS